MLTEGGLPAVYVTQHTNIEVQDSHLCRSMSRDIQAAVKVVTVQSLQQISCIWNAIIDEQKNL